MAFTQATVTHIFQNADGTPASGTIEFTLTEGMTNGTTSLAPTSVNAALDGSGHLSQALTSNADSGTTPSDSQWRVDVRILGASVQTFFIVVPAGGGSVDLYTLIPAAQQVN